MPGMPKETKDSVWQYIRLLGLWGAIVLVAYVLGITGAVQDVKEFPWWGWFLVLTAMLLVPFIAFHKMRMDYEAKLARAKDIEKERDALQNELASRVPRLFGSVDVVSLAVDARRPDILQVLILVTVNNSGEPTVVDGWKVTATTTSGREIDGVLTRIDQGNVIRHSGPGGTSSNLILPDSMQPPAITVTPNDVIFDMVVTDPIIRGGRRIGWLPVEFAVLPNESPGIAELQVECRDIFRNIMVMPWSAAMARRIDPGEGLKKRRVGDPSIKNQ